MKKDTQLSELSEIKEGLIQLFNHMEEVRRELASIRHPKAEKDHIGSMAEQLDAIVLDTEDATNAILHSMEEAGGAVVDLRSSVSDDDDRAKLDLIDERLANVFQACAFQDITGQRITKVVSSLKFLDERINALMDIWGKDAVALEPVTDMASDLAEDDEAALLNGPQLAGNGISQDDIDALFD